MNSGDLVVVACGAPREKYWGVLIGLDAVGATLRAIPVAAFEDWLRQLTAGSAPLIGPTTVFLPSHRIERIELDETSGAVEGLADRVRRVTARDARTELGWEPGPDR
jgi:hypothetical protein